MINCIIIDDEPLARKGLVEYINDIEFLSLKGDFDSPVKAMDLISNDEVQLLFLDIQMPKITGLDFLKPSIVLHPSFLLRPILNMHWMDLR